jgi:thiol:disulfide interchange protein
MSIYLAWSIYKLIGMLVLWLLLTGTLLVIIIPNQKAITNKGGVLVSAVWLVLLLLMAFNIGDRQSSLGRSSFNASEPVSVEKIDKISKSIQNVQDEFNSAVKPKGDSK